MKFVKFSAIFLLAFALTFLLMPFYVFAEESTNTVQCIGISAPYKYSDYDNVSFAVYFDGNITDANYKHLACSPPVLKTMSYWDNPCMTDSVIDKLSESGVIDSMNDCIAINGKKVREWQKTSQLALMILAGELGENSQLNIDFNGAIDDVRIDDLNKPFEISLYKGLKFPNGAVLKNTQIWKYNPEKGVFSEKTGSADKSNADFTAYYNGIKLEKDFNKAEVQNGRFSENNFCVYADNPDTEIVIEPQFKKFESGYNYVYITAKAPDGVTEKSIQLVLDNTYKKPPEKKQIIRRYVKAVSGGILLLIIAVLVFAILLKRRKKQ